MYIFPAFVTPSVAILGVFIPFILVPGALLAFIVWHVRKLNRIDERLIDIQERLKDR